MGSLKTNAKIGDRWGGGVRRGGSMSERARIRGRWKVECFRGVDRIVWVEEFDNIIVNEGLNLLLQNTIKLIAVEAGWFVGLKNTGAAAAADVMNSHGGWTENVTYSNANRPTYTPGTVAAQSVDNSAAKASFSINGSTTIFGAFLTTGNAKSGTTGKLYSAGNFASSRAVENGDTLEVTGTFTTADDGV